ncbi:hypothetical protein EU244_012725 [Rhodococcus qingshengii]|uniref:hypothetical protein n=1 Tax=Rhodococcus qingshengii TaxID=334542 RepID=UPI0010A62AB0|nr:hypothetical protein [Rhodococcus qingshengii]THJ69965.1 hypothetical protein EU244_20110 [Rhodococcus qingshengii]
MSGYQSLADLIADHAGQDLNTNQIEGLANAIILDWLPDEIEAVNEVAQQAQKNAERERTEKQKIAASAQAPNLREQDPNGFAGGF